MVMMIIVIIIGSSTSEAGIKRGIPSGSWPKIGGDNPATEFVELTRKWSSPSQA